MYSSSTSTCSTIPVDCLWSLPAPKETLKDCFKSRSSNEPIYKLIPYIQTEEKSADNKLCQKKSTKTEKYCSNTNRNVLANWMRNIYAKDTRNLEDVLKEDISNNNMTKKTLAKLRKNGKIWCPDKSKSYKCLPCTDKYYCYPLIIIDLGIGFIHYKTMMEFIYNGVKAFLFDLRYTTEKINLKIIEHVKHARKQPNFNSQGQTELLFASLFLITGRILETGLNKFDRDISIESGSSLLLTADRHFSNKCDTKIIYINFADYIKKIVKDDIIEIGPKIKVQVINEYVNSVSCIVLQGGFLKSKCLIKLPTKRTLSHPPQVTIEEETDIMLAFELGCDFIVIPYPFSVQVITFIHWVTAAQHRTLKIFAKIDLTRNFTTSEEQLLSDIQYCIGLYLYLDKLTDITPTLKTILKVCLEQQKSIIWGGLFDCDIKTIIVPDDEEIKKYMFLYPEGLSIKTNNPGFKSEIRRFIRNNYPEMNKLNLQISCNPLAKLDLTIENMFLKYMVTSTLKTRSSCIIVTNNSGKTVSLFARLRPIVPIITSFCDAPTARRTMLLRNVYSLMYYNPVNSSWNDELELRLAYCVEYAKSLGILNQNDSFIYCFDSKRGIKFSDSYRILALDNIYI